MFGNQYFLNWRGSVGKCYLTCYPYGFILWSMMTCYFQRFFKKCLKIQESTVGRRAKGAAGASWRQGEAKGMQPLLLDTFLQKVDLLSLHIVWSDLQWNAPLLPSKCAPPLLRLNHSKGFDVSIDRTKFSLNVYLQQINLEGILQLENDGCPNHSESIFFSVRSRAWIGKSVQCKSPMDFVSNYRGGG